jgi:hypothetical protein
MIFEKEPGSSDLRLLWADFFHPSDEIRITAILAILGLVVIYILILSLGEAPPPSGPPGQWPQDQPARSQGYMDG